MSTSNIAPITFNGSSTFSSSFQQVLTRAVSIASLPEQALQGDVTTLQGQASALSTLNGNFSALQSALQAVGTAAAGSPSAQVSDSSSVTAAAASGALPGTYEIQVDNVGSSTTTLSNDGLTTVTDPSSQNISSASSFTLTLNGNSTTITPSGNTLNDLASAINQAGAGVQATIINVGSNSSPDYRLAVTSNELGGDTIGLTAVGSSTNLLTTLASGADATYQVNGSQTILQSTSSQITLSPGLTVNLLGQSSGTVTITVTNDLSGLSSALQNFASAYNSATAAVQQNRGQSGGALTGDSIINEATDVLSQLGQYNSGSGAVSNLAEIGLTFDQNGNLNFDASALSSANPADIQSFLGSTSSSGYLSAANNELNSITDSTSGAIAGEISSIQSEITNDNSQISNDQSRVSDLQTSLQAQLSQADAAIATLQSENTYFQELFQAEYGTSGTNSSGG